MSKLVRVLSATLLLWAAGVASAKAGPAGLTLAVVMTNDSNANQIKVYDTKTGSLVQTLPTNGKGGAGVNARGVRQYQGELFAAVNYGSSTVALFRHVGDRLTFERMVTTTSPPLSIDFANDHMYVAGTTTVDSFVISNGRVGSLDGTTGLVLADGSTPPAGSTGQVGAIDSGHLLVTLKNDPDPGTIDVVALTDGSVTGVPTAVPVPDGSLAPFGFDVYPDGSAVITLAHSNQNGLFRDGAFVEISAAGQTANCWMTRVDKYLFTANTASRTLSRLVGTGSHVFVDGLVAATISTGSPLDTDAANGVLAVIDHGNGRSHLSLFTLNAFGELSASLGAIDLDAADANGVAVIPAFTS